MAPLTGTVIKTWSIKSIKSNSPLDLKGKNMLIVGGTSGLGRAIALNACAKGASVTVVGRKQQEEDKVVPNLTFVQADLSSMKKCKEIGETVLGDSVQSLDVVLLTNGIIAKSTRQETSEGIEEDMAVSYLSRIVLMKYLEPRLSKEKKCRVFVMGFPGTNPPSRLDDLNAERAYEGGPGWVHMNTVMGNEAFVLHSASKRQASHLLYFGLNPGLIKTGIRDNVWSSGWFMKLVIGPLVESLIALFSNSPKSYATKIVPLLFAPELDQHNGSLFNPKAEPIVASTAFTADPNLASKVIKDSEILVKEKSGVDM